MNKRVLASLLTCSLGLALSAQVTVFVNQPAGLAGALDYTIAAWGQQPDPNDPANNITATACFVDDGTAADSLGCNALVNGSQLTGKIAVVYRGSCEFGVKSLNAETAGAIAVIIINNVGGAPVGMGAGAQGANVTIPVVMISQTSGELLHDAIASCGDAEIFIGTQTNLYQHNIGIYKADVIVPRIAEVPPLIASDASELTIPIGAVINNYGSMTMDGARLHCVITDGGGNTVYDQTSTGTPLLTGEFLTVSLPDFSQPGYDGQYTITYTALGDVTDELTSNNEVGASLTIGDKLSFCPADATTELPITGLHLQPGNNTTGFLSCISFSDPNLSRLGAAGVLFSTSRAADQVLTDEIMTGTLYQWNDPITDQITLPTDAGIVPLTSGEYTFPSDQDGETIYLPFTDQVILEDNQWYLVCLESYSGIVRHGWDNSIDYGQIQTITLVPNSCLKDKTDNTWYNGFTGISGAPSLALQTFDATTIGITEQPAEIAGVPSPNPVHDVLRVPVKGYSGPVAVRAFSSTGALVLNQRGAITSGGQLSLNMSDLVNGVYNFHLDFDGDQHAEFRVVVSH